MSVKVRPAPLLNVKASSREQVAAYLASSRVKDISKPIEPSEPMYGEVDYELRTLRGDARIGGIVYDGRRIEEILIGLLRSSNELETATIVMTDRFISTYSQDDLRHHLRTVIPGFPSIISVPGMVEAPAKPRQYYMLKQRLASTGGESLNIELLKRTFKGRFLDYGDPEMTEVAKGLALQAVLHHLTLKPFCADKKCRLFNAHWQEDLLGSQTGSPGLCPKHSRRMKRLGENPIVSW
ncbi:MAG: hypothetical protein A3K60_06485 [Euryarchaeota archaeon RBG_19FT_COMBO_56_21]|nr:MAG: hypothetical protein A3K60_06485 [Euryarchaeota archaeon RBG_19FT_COMBO_56_21]